MAVLDKMANLVGQQDVNCLESRATLSLKGCLYILKLSFGRGFILHYDKVCDDGARVSTLSFNGV